MNNAPEPCPDGEHDFTDYFESWQCSTPYCSAGEEHCRKCGWFIGSCQCGFENGLSRSGRNHFLAMERRKRNRLSQNK